MARAVCTTDAPSRLARRSAINEPTTTAIAASMK